MEIYLNDSTATSFVHVPASVIAAGPNVTVEAWENGVKVYEFATVEAVPEAEGQPSGFRVALPWTLVNEGRDLYIDWRISYVENGVPRVFRDRKFVQVITPILPLEEVARISGWTDEADIRDLERRVRYAIQAFCGQNFGKFRTTYEIGGNGQKRIALPAPLIGVFNANFRLEHVEIYADGWYLKTKWASNDGYSPMSLSRLDGFYYSGAPIVVNPHRAVFEVGQSYRIGGLWGYYDVPGDVQQAARLLVTDYSCDESLWRDRFITSVRSGNWRFEMESRAMDGTGNVVADQILLRYRRLSLAMI